jgi:deoxyribodipyrimidine photo-lyase
MVDYHVFIFRRDLRVHDNHGFCTLLHSLYKEVNAKILPIFIFNKKQVAPTINTYYSKNCVEFMVQSLKSLNDELHGNLLFFETENDDTKVLDALRKTQSITSISFNKDFTPFAIQRDTNIETWCKKHNVKCNMYDDYTLLPINSFTTTSGSWFSVFTPFYRKFLAHSKLIPSIITSDKKQLEKLVYNSQIAGKIKINDIEKYHARLHNKELFVTGGRDEALKIITKIRSGYFKNYDKERDLPAHDGTTKLSAYLKFGCVSIREVYFAIKDTYGIDHGLIRELIWRDFYANITFNRPRVLEGQTKKDNQSFKEKYDNIKWSSNKEWFLRWCKGTTGVPLVDASIRQMLVTGWMHNRCRMVVASYLCKDMLMDWRDGERFFATCLVDYDPSSNNGGWQFCSSTGVDAQPYFRIFNPYTQAKRFDPNCEYIKRWVPELKDVPIQHIHAWNEKHHMYTTTKITTYPPPMLEHSVQIKKALSMYKDALQPTITKS